MEPERAPTEAEPCPFLVAVMADHLWPRPVSNYCRRPDGRLRVPAPVAVTCICMTPAHLVCAGYLAAVETPGMNIALGNSQEGESP